MASISMVSTPTLESSLTGDITVLQYLWCSTERIQDYLDQESPIAIGSATNEISENNARRIENSVVREIVSYLSSSYSDITESYFNHLLRDLACKLTAAMLGVSRYSASMAISDPQDWTNRYKNEVWTQLKDLFINQTLPNLTVRDLPYWKLVWMSRRRERTVMINA